MEMKYPQVRIIHLKCAPSQAPCPACGKLGKRKDVLRRQVRSIAYKQIVCFDITYGEYRVRCDCCTTFRTTPPGVEPRALYDNKVREAVLDRILEDGMSVERVIHSMHRDFLLDLSNGFVYDCLYDQARRLDMADHRRWVVERSPGPCASMNCTWGGAPSVGHRSVERSAGGVRRGGQQGVASGSDR